MNIWIDLTNSPHVLVMRPVIERLRAAGHDVTVTARDFAQTLPLLARLQIDHEAIGRHRGGRVGAKALGLAERSLTLTRWAAGRSFDIALGHGSNDVTVAAALLRIPSSTMFDYEWARVQHHVNCRLAAAVVVPDAIPSGRLRRYGAGGKERFFPGIKEEYYLADFEPAPQALEELSLDPARPMVLLRTPPDLALYHRLHNDLFGGVIERLRSRPELQVVVLARTAAQREGLRALGGLIVPEGAVDGPSLVAHAALVVSAGGTMNREAVALGTPVWTTFAGRLGAVDERLIAEGRLRALHDAAQLPLDDLSPRRDGARRVRRDPQLLVDLLLSPL